MARRSSDWTCRKGVNGRAEFFSFAASFFFLPPLRCLVLPSWAASITEYMRTFEFWTRSWYMRVRYQ